MRSSLLLLCLSVAACGGFSSANVAKTAPTYDKPTVAARSDVPLTIILDPQAVHDDMVLSGYSPADIHQVSLIVTRDLKSALEVYFSRVTVTPISAEKTERHQVVTNVKIDALGWKSADSNAAVGTMEWSVSMRFADQQKPFYRFAEHTVGRHAIRQWSNTDALIQGAIEEGMQHLLKDMEAKGVQTLVAPAEAATPPESPPASDAPAADDEQ
ncbi:MAG TPA: hypothetical protein VGC79_20280 [Polyangiaceae bacterium]